VIKKTLVSIFLMSWTSQKTNHTLTRDINLHRHKTPRLREHVSLSATHHIKSRSWARIVLHVSSNRP